MNKNLVLKSNKYLANVGVEYIKLHNLHWNVIGLQFKAVHEYLESLYDSLADVLDEVAELIKSKFLDKRKIELTAEEDSMLKLFFAIIALLYIFE